MAPRKHQIIEIEKTQNGTLPSFYQAVASFGPEFLGTDLISNFKFEI